MKHFHFAEITSTNDYAKDLLASNDVVFVTCDYQTGGRGRNQKVWLGDYGNNLYFSVGIKHQTPPDIELISAYQGLGCLAVMRCLQAKLPIIEFALKYPNDVMAKMDGAYKKICGVLIEHSFLGSACESTIIGAGVNVNQTKFPELPGINPVSMKQLGGEFDLTSLTKDMIATFRALLKLDLEQIHLLWEKELNISGREITLVSDQSKWIADGILTDGRLMLHSPDGAKQKIIDNGDSIRYL